MFYAHSDSQCSVVTMRNEKVDLEGQFWKKALERERERERERECVCVCNPHREIYSHKRKTKWKRKQSERLRGVDGRPAAVFSGSVSAGLRKNIPSAWKNANPPLGCGTIFTAQSSQRMKLTVVTFSTESCAAVPWTNRALATRISLCRLHLDATVNVLHYRSVGITSKMVMLYSENHSYT